MTRVTDDTSAEWSQDAFERSDRRRARRTSIGGAEKTHDVLHLSVEHASRERVHELLREHSRHTDVVHSHGDALILSCAPGDAEGLRAKLAANFAAEGLAHEMSHGTFSAGSDIGQNVAALRTD